MPKGLLTPPSIYLYGGKKMAAEIKNLNPTSRGSSAGALAGQASERPVEGDLVYIVCDRSWDVAVFSGITELEDFLNVSEVEIKGSVKATVSYTLEGYPQVKLRARKLQVQYFPESKKVCIIARRR